MRSLAVLLTLLCLSCSAASELEHEFPEALRVPHAFSVHDMLAMRRISDPQVSPDGSWVAYSAVQVDLPNNARNSDLWLVPLNATRAPERAPAAKMQGWAFEPSDGNSR